MKSDCQGSADAPACGNTLTHSHTHTDRQTHTLKLVNWSHEAKGQEQQKAHLLSLCECASGFQCVEVQMPSRTLALLKPGNFL